MQTIIDKTPFRIFPTKMGADVVANAAQEEDPDWTYFVTSTPRGFVISIYDEDGVYVGNHP